VTDVYVWLRHINNCSKLWCKQYLWILHYSRFEKKMKFQTFYLNVRFASPWISFFEHFFIITIKAHAQLLQKCRQYGLSSKRGKGKYQRDVLCLTEYDLALWFIEYIPYIFHTIFIYNTVWIRLDMRHILTQSATSVYLTDFV
jgi:hypothetical protein